MSLLTAALLASTAASQPVDVRVERSGQQFTAEFTLPRSAPSWGFFRSADGADGKGPWRTRSWKVLTPGVRLERRGHYDALVATNGGPVPRTVRVSLEPFTGDLASDYVPALRLGSSGIALFDGHFALFSTDVTDQLASLPRDLHMQAIGDSGTRVRFEGPAGRLRLAGDTAGLEKGNSAGTYGLYDVPGAIEQNGMATVVDGGLPGWLADDIRAFTPRVLAHYRRSLGPSGEPRPTVLASWAGADKSGASLNGGVLKGLVLMRISGQAALQPNPGLRAMARKFIAHESSHFWLGQRIDITRASESWINEGGADFLAIRTMAAADPAYDGRAALQKSLDACLPASRKGGIASAAERRDTQAWYDCGAILSLVAERSAGNFPRFFGRLEVAAGEDGKVSEADWLATLDAVAPGRNLSSLMRPLLHSPQPDLRGWLDLLKAGGIAFRLRPDGTPELL